MLTVLRLLLLLIALIESPSHAEETVPIIFENRAACALDSKLPSESAFLMVDSYNAGKLLDSWIKGLDPNTSSQLSVEGGLKIFRVAVTETILTLANQILAGTLPLLSSDEGRVPDAEFNLILKECSGRQPCPQMESYLEGVFAKWRNLSANPDTALYGSSMSCFFVKRFSALQSNWSSERPDQALLQNIANNQIQSKDLLSDCFDESESLSNRRFLLQLNVLKVSPRWWRFQGHDFWYTLKLYFSFAWRHPELILGQNEPILDLFRNLAIEQMVSLFSNGCKSIERPQCSQRQAGLDQYRALARLGEPVEFDHPFLRRSDQVVLDTSPLLSRKDSAVLPIDQDVEIWLKGFQERIMQNRGLLKQKILNAVSMLELIKSTIPPGALGNHLDLIRMQMGVNQSAYLKLQVLCSEISITIHPEFGILEKRLPLLRNQKSLQYLMASISESQFGDLIDFGLKTLHPVQAFCEAIQLQKGWNSSGSPQASDFALWYQDLIKSAGEKKATIDALGDRYNEDLNLGAALLNQSQGSLSSLVCRDGSDCARLILKSLVDLYSVSTWTESFTPAKEWILSPNLANPWATETACKIYDPWFATKQAMTGLLGDLLTTTLTGVAPAPGYLALGLKPGQVNQLIQEQRGDEIVFQPARSGSGLTVSLGIDLGPWTGIPCTAILSPNSVGANTNGFYTLAGIRAEACTATDLHRVQFNGSGEDPKLQGQPRSACLMCYLNPYSAARSLGTLSSAILPATRIAAGMIFSGINFVRRLNNPIDVPKRYTVDPDQLLLTQQKFSFIPKHCVRRLIHGKSCLNPRLTHEERDRMGGGT